ncbi:MAG: hypothetical protein GF317_03755 [Candidatus Lokiarchaeota archaeon]|nr:hypothetical protein [Candidatus Lokiarchaeota archaeon]MBD3199003.1 hypothetical protein [Candidatus Lokiarchaeota archaeon]
MVVEFTILDFLNGFFSFLTILTALIVGLIIIKRYLEHKTNVLLFIGLAWMALYQPWWPSAFSFLSVLFTGTRFPIQIYLFVGNFFIPVSITLWFLGVTNLILQNKKKILISFYLILSIIATILIIYFIFTNYQVIGMYGTGGLFDVEFETSMVLYLLFLNATIAITGIMMGRESLSSNDPEIKMKGKFLILGSLFYTLGGLLDVGLLNLIPEALVITRTILILGSIFFYFGLFLPKFVKKLIFRKKNL